MEQVTICSSHEAIEIESCGTRLKDRQSFYSAKVRSVPHLPDLP